MQPKERAPIVEPIGRFASKAAILLAMIGAALAAWTLREVVFILFGALVLANGMNAAALFLARKLRIRYALGLLAVVTTGLIVLGAVGWFFGATINNQLEELSDKIPEGLQWLTNQIEARPYTRDLLSKLEINDLSGTTGWIAKTLTPILRSFLGAAGSLVVMAIVSIYLAAQPERYRSGALRLLPISARSKASELLDATGNILGRWLAGQVAVMATVGLLSGVGLWLLGIDAAFVLGLVGGLMSFVPYLGSVMTAILATLFALAQGPYHAAAVIVMYICVHFVEGNFITPLIQAEATSLPPAITLLAVISCAILFGPSAAFLAAPLTLSLPRSTFFTPSLWSSGKPATNENIVGALRATWSSGERT
ncbi:MAG: AI-2E family transporter [Methylocystis sp.]